MSSMYREQIMDHYKHPRNFGELPNADVVLDIDNPLCGDKLKLQIKFSRSKQKDRHPEPVEGSCGLTLGSFDSALAGSGSAQEDVVTDVKFSGQGCAISVASASLFTEYLKNKTCAELLAIDEDVVYKLLGIEINSGRIKCALLPLAAIREGVRLARRSFSEGGGRLRKK